MMIVSDRSTWCSAVHDAWEREATEPCSLTPVDREGDVVTYLARDHRGQPTVLRTGDTLDLGHIS